MTDKQAAIELLSSLPEEASLDAMIEEMKVLAAVKRGRAAVAAGRTKTQEEVEELVESWANS